MYGSWDVVWAEIYTFLILKVLIYYVTLIINFNLSFIYKEPSCVGLVRQAKLRFGLPSFSTVFGLFFRAVLFNFSGSKMIFI